MDENVKIALIITWLLPKRIGVKEFSIIYWATYEELKNFHVSTQPFGIDALKNEVSSYVDISEEINFRHSSYEEGITEGILDHYFDTVFSILKIFINTDMPLEWNCQLTPKCNLVQTRVVKESVKELKPIYEENARECNEFC